MNHRYIGQKAYRVAGVEPPDWLLLPDATPPEYQGLANSIASALQSTVVAGTKWNPCDIVLSKLSAGTTLKECEECYRGQPSDNGNADLQIVIKGDSFFSNWQSLIHAYPVVEAAAKISKHKIGLAAMAFDQSLSEGFPLAFCWCPSISQNTLYDAIAVSNSEVIFGYREYFRKQVGLPFPDSLVPSVYDTGDLTEQELVTKIHYDAVHEQLAFLEAHDRLAKPVSLVFDGLVRHFEEVYSHDGYHDTLTRNLALEILGKTEVLVKDSSPVSVRPPSTVLGPHEVLKVVEIATGVNTEDILGKSQAEMPACARHLAMHLLRKTSSRTLQRVASELGRRNHSTVWNGQRRMEGFVQSNAMVFRFVDMLTEQVDEMGLTKGFLLRSGTRPSKSRR